MERRHFLVSTIGALGASASVFADTPSDKLRVAVIGMGGKDPQKGLGRGGTHLSAWAEREGAKDGGRDRGSEVKNCEVSAICDIDDAQLAKGLKVLEGYKVKTPQTYKDIRKVLDNKDIDVLSIATPNHWHTLMTIWGVQAGKDVYVEKPCSHNIFEAKQIVAAARKYNRIVQQGSQIRSSKAVQEAVQKMREGLIGDIYMSRGLCFKWRDTIGRTPQSSPFPPASITTCGPVPRPCTRSPATVSTTTGTGSGTPATAISAIRASIEVDIARWGLGVKYPDEGQRHRRTFHVRRRSGNARTR